MLKELPGFNAMIAMGFNNNASELTKVMNVVRVIRDICAHIFVLNPTLVVSGWDASSE